MYGRWRTARKSMTRRPGRFTGAVAEKADELVWYGDSGVSALLLYSLRYAANKQYKGQVFW